MINYKLTKQSFKKLSQLINDDPKIAISIKEFINNLRGNKMKWEFLTGNSDFKKVRIWKYRLIYTIKENTLIIALIEKREIVYEIFKHMIKKSSIFK